MKAAIISPLLPLLLGGALSLTATACYTELGEVHCFGDGSARPQDGASTICCDPAGADPDQTCRDFYRGTPFAYIADLGACDPGGFCTISCTPGLDCECFDGADCDQQTSCQVTGLQTACLDHGQSARRCAICQECEEDADCDGHPRGQRCVDGAACGCSTNADCDNATCQDGACQ